MKQNTDHLKAMLEWGTPASAKTVEALMDKVDDQLAGIKKEVEELESASENFLKPLRDKTEEVKLKIPRKDGKPDYAALPDADLKQISGTLEGILRSLGNLNQGEIAVGKWCFWTFLVLLVVVSIIYVGLHWWMGPGRSVPDDTIAGVEKNLRKIELEIAAWRTATAKDPAAVLDVKPAGQAMHDLRATARSIDFSTTFLRLMGALEAEIEKGAGAVLASNTFEKLKKQAGDDLESARTSWLWQGPCMRWLEIALWAMLGTLVGILFFIAGSLSGGRFPVADIPMFWAEFFISPLVIMAVFFLFSLTGVAGVSPQELTGTATVGFAFILGFAIRRTLGLLDTIKKRIFPDPAPAS